MEEKEIRFTLKGDALTAHEAYCKMYNTSPGLGAKTLTIESLERKGFASKGGE